MPRKRGTSARRTELVRLALAGIDAEIEALQEKRSQLTRMASGGGGTRRARRAASVKASSAKPAKARRKVSMATRRKLKAAAKKRWARVKAAQAS